MKEAIGKTRWKLSVKGMRMGNDTIIRQFMPSVLQLNEGYPGIWTVVEGVVEVYVGRRGTDGLRYAGR